mmetsp:Transcript_69333/g.160622  ORF Transcript_69333/g.160622 Transcript_69333/m.160622 type:complete len:275 (+) Transcript_69333:369-1193(+)
MLGQCGHGVSVALLGGGLGSSSRFTMLLAPWRTDVPMQSLPVSPPPMMMTLLSRASMGGFWLLSLASRHPPSTFPVSRIALVFPCKNSMAKCTPLNCLPGTWPMSRANVAPVASSTASLSASSFCAVGPPSLPTAPALPHTKVTPSLAMTFVLRSTTSTLSAFMFGTPYIMRPPKRSERSYTVTQWPILLSSSAAARPDGPEPTMATRLPVRAGGGLGFIQPLRYASSTMNSSTDLMLTGSSMMPRVHAASQGAGQTLPVNSGKLLVCLSLWKA